MSFGEFGKVLDIYTSFWFRIAPLLCRIHCPIRLFLFTRHKPLIIALEAGIPPCCLSNLAEVTIQSIILAHLRRFLNGDKVKKKRFKPAAVRYQQASLQSSPLFPSYSFNHPHPKKVFCLAELKATLILVLENNYLAAAAIHTQDLVRLLASNRPLILASNLDYSHHANKERPLIMGGICPTSFVP